MWNPARRGWRSGHQGGCGFDRTSLGSQPARAGTCAHGSPSRWHKRPRLEGPSEFGAPVPLANPLATASPFIALWVVLSRQLVGGGCGLTDNRASCAAPHPSPMHPGQVGS